MGAGEPRKGEMWERKEIDEIKETQEPEFNLGNASHAETIHFKSAPCVLQSLIIP